MLDESNPNSAVLISDEPTQSHLTVANLNVSDQTCLGVSLPISAHPRAEPLNRIINPVLVFLVEHWSASPSNYDDMRIGSMPYDDKMI